MSFQRRSGAGVLAPTYLASSNNSGKSGVTGGPATSPTVAGYQGWWAADKITGQGDNTALATWPDGSGNGHDLTQATGAQQPTYYKTTVGKTVNGRPAVWFGGTGVMATAAWTLAQPFTVVMVLQLSSTAAVSVPYSTNAGTVYADTNAGATSWTLAMGGTAGGQNFTIGTTLHFLVAIGNGASDALQQDGTQQSYSTVGSSGLSGAFLVGGFNTAGANSWPGPICEAIVYPSALSAANISALRSYAQAKWGTP